MNIPVLLVTCKVNSTLFLKATAVTNHKTCHVFKLKCNKSKPKIVISLESIVCDVYVVCLQMVCHVTCVVWTDVESMLNEMSTTTQGFSLVFHGCVVLQTFA